MNIQTALHQLLLAAMIYPASLLAAPDFGPNVHIFSPSDDSKDIANEFKRAYTNMRTAHFSDERHAFLLMPGDYRKVGLINIGFYTTIAGLGQTPYEVQISNMTTPTPFKGTKNSLCTFWRAAENLTVKKTDSKAFVWAVSQASPLRRVVSERKVMYDMGGYSSGGFTADCRFLNAAGSHTQQQWYTRNSYIDYGSDGINPGGWNYACQGVVFGPRASKENNSNTWSKGNPWGNVSIEASTPIIREKPFLFVNSEGRFKVFRPALRYNSSGISYTSDSMGEGSVLDVENEFYIVFPGTSARIINAQLEAGKHLLFTPGIFDLEEPLIVKRNGTIVLGLGLATLVPGLGNTEAAIIIADGVEDATVASLMLDARNDSRYLMQVGTSLPQNENIPTKPILLADLFFRVGGVVKEAVNANVMLEINTNGVICDHFWLWRADHGDGVGWSINTCKNGLVVNGHHVTSYGLCNEHTQEYQTLWNGEWGRCYFYQSETPYDPQQQSDFMSHDGTVKGYASYKVADHVQHHYAAMMGIYDVFTKTGGTEIVAESSIEVPNHEGVRVHHACNFGLSRNGGGFNFVINQSVPSTHHKKGRYYILDY